MSSHHRRRHGRRSISGGNGALGSPVDTMAREQLLLRLGRLAEDQPAIAELHLRPVLAGPDGLTVTDVKLRLAPVGAELDPMLRRLTLAAETWDGSPDLLAGASLPGSGWSA